MDANTLEDIGHHHEHTTWLYCTGSPGIPNPNRIHSDEDDPPGHPNEPGEQDDELYVSGSLPQTHAIGLPTGGANSSQSDAEEDSHILHVDPKDNDDWYIHCSHGTATPVSHTPSRGPQFQLKPSKLVSSGLPKHLHLNSSLPHPPSTISSTPSRSAMAQSQPPSDPPSPHLPFTPWKPKEKPGKASMSQHSPQSTSILWVATAILQTLLATTESVFASEDKMTREIKASFLEACDQIEPPRRTACFHVDLHYAAHVMDILGNIQINQCISQLCGNVVKDAWALILGHAGFGLLLYLPTDDLKARVKFLLTNGHRVFGDVDSPLATGLYAPQFNPIPLPLLALVMTMVECALRHWESGENQMKTNPFQHEEYVPVYNHHIYNLKRYQTESLGAFRKLQENTWTAAWFEILSHSS
ncbi:hypothetical protein K439DRAFT_1618210 [Ramaria rubella]|nr:hypothetical protein K439DRAFT_1618210 [Ramaria rubella]